MFVLVFLLWKVDGDMIFFKGDFMFFIVEEYNNGLWNMEFIFNELLVCFIFFSNYMGYI